MFEIYRDGEKLQRQAHREERRRATMSGVLQFLAFMAIFFLGISASAWARARNRRDVHIQNHIGSDVELRIYCVNGSSTLVDPPLPAVPHQSSSVAEEGYSYSVVQAVVPGVRVVTCCITWEEDGARYYANRELLSSDLLRLASNGDRLNWHAEGGRLALVDRGNTLKRYEWTLLVPEEEEEEEEEGGGGDSPGHRHPGGN